MTHCRVCQRPVKASITTCGDCLRALYNQWTEKPKTA